MRVLLKDCPRHYIPGTGVRIEDSELHDKKGREVVDCFCCSWSRKNGCKLIDAALELARINGKGMPKKKLTTSSGFSTFEKLVEEATRRIHSALLEGGGKEMKSEVYLWLGKAVEFDREMRSK